MSITTGSAFSLECLGTGPGTSRFLDGRTANATVGLSPNTEAPFTGARWVAVDLQDGGLRLICLGALSGPRLLDGVTAAGTVGLAPQQYREFTGTRWEVRSVGGDAVAFKCLGSIPSPNVFLDGRTADGTVGLAPQTGGVFTGTHWRAVKLVSSPSIGVTPVRTQTGVDMTVKVAGLPPNTEIKTFFLGVPRRAGFESGGFGISGGDGVASAFTRFSFTSTDHDDSFTSVIVLAHAAGTVDKSAATTVSSANWVA